MTGCAEVRLSLGAHALGALDPAEAAAVEAHLAGCPRCRAEADALAGLPELLGRVSAADVARVSAPPQGVLDRMLHAAARRRRRHRLLLALAASVAVAAVGGAALAGLAGRQAGVEDAAAPVTAARPEAREAQEAAPGAAEARQDRDAGAAADTAGAGGAGDTAGAGGTDGAGESLAETLSGPAEDADPPAPVAAGAGRSGPAVELIGERDGVRAVLRLRPGAAPAGGTTVELTVTGVPEGRVVAVAADGARETVADWAAGTGFSAGPVTFPIDRIDRFEVLSRAGAVLLTVPRR